MLVNNIYLYVYIQKTLKKFIFNINYEYIINFIIDDKKYVRIYQKKNNNYIIIVQNQYDLYLYFELVFLAGVYSFGK